MSIRWPTVAQHGMPARVFLSFLATAGFFYINIMPALVSGLIDALQFTPQQAGWVSSANVYGAAFGALTVVFLVGKLRWRPLAIALLCGLMVLDAISISMREPQSLIVVRFVHGCIGGMLVGLTYSIIARTRDPDRTFGVLLVVQFGLGGIGLWLLPSLTQQLGTQALFLTLIAFALTALLMLQFLPAYEQPAALDVAESSAKPVWPLLLTLLAVFLFQAANMGLSAYIIEIARAAGLSSSQIGPALGLANWLGILGASVVVFLSARFGRTVPVVAGIAVTAAGSWCLHFSHSAIVYFVANAIVAITWAMVIAYLLGMCAQLKADGRAAVLGGFVSKIGLASGPAAFAWGATGASYAPLIDLSVVALVMSAVAAWLPVRLLDRHAAKNT